MFSGETSCPTPSARPAPGACGSSGLRRVRSCHSSVFSLLLLLGSGGGGHAGMDGWMVDSSNKAMLPKPGQARPGL